MYVGVKDRERTTIAESKIKGFKTNNAIINLQEEWNSCGLKLKQNFTLPNLSKVYFCFEVFGSSAEYLSKLCKYFNR